jgi:FMN phosphatase YigB (HAD superfamily)
MNEVDLGKRVGAVRRSKGMTQQQLCGAANISYSTLAKIERGAIRSPSIFTIQHLAEAMSVSLGQLIGESMPIKPNIESNIKFVFFDVNGCLVRFYHRAFAAIAHETGGKIGKIENVFWHYNDSICRGQMEIAEFNQKITEAADSNQTIIWNDYYLKAIDSMPGMDKLLTDVVASLPTGLLTNIMPGQLDSLIHGGLVPDLSFSTVVDSSIVGYVKPDRKIFEIAEELSGYSGEQILLIDDSRANLMAAESMSWQVAWFNDQEPQSSIESLRTILSL